MLENSIVTTSGQRWKIGIAVFLVTVSLLLIYVGLHSSFDLLVPVAFVCDILGFLILFFAVACPNCGCRWVWFAAKTHPKPAFLGGLDEMSKCPRCEWTPER